MYIQFNSMRFHITIGLPSIEALAEKLPQQQRLAFQVSPKQRDRMTAYRIQSNLRIELNRIAFELNSQIYKIYKI